MFKIISNYSKMIMICYFRLLGWLKKGGNNRKFNNVNVCGYFGDIRF